MSENCLLLRIYRTAKHDFANKHLYFLEKKRVREIIINGLKREETVNQIEIQKLRQIEREEERKVKVSKSK